MNTCYDSCFLLFYIGVLGHIRLPLDGGVFFPTVKLKNAYVNLKNVSSKSMEFQFWVNLAFNATETYIFQHVWRLLRTLVTAYLWKSCKMEYFTVYGDVAAQFIHVQRFCFPCDPYQPLVPVTCPHTGIAFIIRLSKACFLTLCLFCSNLILLISWIRRTGGTTL